MKDTFTRGGLAVLVLALAMIANPLPAWATSGITKVTPEQGCPGEQITIEGFGFEPKQLQMVWEDKLGHQPGSWEKVQVKATFIKSTKLTAIIPLFVQIEGNGSGELTVGSAHYSPFVYTKLTECFGGKEGKAGATGATGATGPTGNNGSNGANGSNGSFSGGGLPENGSNGTNGSNGANGSNGTNGSNGQIIGCGACGNSEATNVGNPYESAEPGGLASKKQESGLWSATISVPKGGLQTEVSAAVSFPIPLKFHEKVFLTYRNETESNTPSPPCSGSPNEPIVEPGNLCTYRGGNGLGSKETGLGPTDKNAKFVQFESAFGEPIAKTGSANAGNLGVEMVFRTEEFNEEGTLVTLAKEALMHAEGSWAVRAK